VSPFHHVQRSRPLCDRSSPRPGQRPRLTSLIFTTGIAELGRLSIILNLNYIDVPLEPQQS
jgi:hypothetical protein